MKKTLLRPLPPENLSGTWPLLIVKEEDRRFKVRTLTQREMQLMQWWKMMSMTLCDARDAALKGAFLGWAAFSLVFGLLSFSAFWLSPWYWVFLLGGAGLLCILVGFNTACMLILLGAFGITLGLLLTQWQWLFICIGAGIILRCVIEFLPKKI